MEDIKKFAKEELKKNGNLFISNKEMLIYLVNKVDWLVENKIGKTTFWIIVGGGFSFMIFMLSIILAVKGGLI